ncbi:MAG: sigma factor-like helix-turn-helix DNA-binding protein [Cetobacterium sp.]
MTKQVLPEKIRTVLKTVQIEHFESLPNYIVSLRNRGWTLDSIAEPLGLSRERVRQLAAKADAEAEAEGDYRHIDAEFMGVADRPEKVVAEKVKKERPEPLPENVARMLELKPLAQQVRANNTEHREAAEEYTWLIHYENYARGVSLYRLAQVLGVTHGALRFRLVRYGYRNTESDSRVYKKVLDKNRVV